MNVQEMINYQNAVIESAKDWVKGEAAIDGQEELILIADHYNVRLPVCMKHFQYSEAPNWLCATGAHKTILKTLDKLKEAILKEIE